MTEANEIPESIDDLDLTVRTYNCLKREGIHTLSALAACTEFQLLDIRNFGQRSVDECVAKLAEYGMHLRVAPNSLFDGRIEVEHVTHYRWGGLQVTVDGDGSGHISLRDLSPSEMDGLAQIMREITAAQTEKLREHVAAAAKLDWSGEETPCDTSDATPPEATP